MGKLDEIIVKYGSYQLIKELLDYHNLWSEFIEKALPILRTKIKQLGHWEMFLDTANKIESEDVFRPEAELESYLICRQYIDDHQPVLSIENRIALYGRSPEEIEEANNEAELRWLEAEFDRLGIGWDEANRIVDEEYNDLQKKNEYV